MCPAKSMRSRCVLSAVSNSAKELLQFAAMASAGLAWELLAKSVSVRWQVPPAAAVAAPAAAAGKQQADQAAAAAGAAVSPPTEATAAHYPPNAMTTSGTGSYLGGVAAKRPAEAEATSHAEKRLKAAIANA